MPDSVDRLSRLRSAAADFTGIEFVQVVEKCDQTRLRVYFLTDTLSLRPPFEDVGDAEVVPQPLTLDNFRIYSPRGVAPDVPLVACPAMPAGMQWEDDLPACRRYLEICVAQPGEFTDYRLYLDDERVDRGFNDVPFSFKVGCDGNLDCARPPNPCPPEPPVDFPVDYLARDFVSLRNALLDFAAQKYPDWQLPTEADVGVMFMEVMAALGDEFSYVQDRLNREAYLETATERRSLRKKARLVDHEIHDGRMARTMIELTVKELDGDGVPVTSVQSGWPIWARTEGGDPIPFELGEGLNAAGKQGDVQNYAVDARWNAGSFTPYRFDDEQVCLELGATELFVHNDAASPGGVVLEEDDVALWPGRLLLLRDRPQDLSEVERVYVVEVVEVERQRDDLFGIDIARIRWSDDDALPFPIPLDDLQLSGNIVPATAGETRTELFRLGPLQPGDQETGVIEAIERAGPLFSQADPSLLQRRDRCAEVAEEVVRRPPIYLLSLPDTDLRGLAFADHQGDLRRTFPELCVFPVAEDEEAEASDPWQFRRSLLVDSGDDESYTLEDGTWRRIIGYWRDGQEVVHRDYATGAGYSVRLGDGEFGLLPAAGTKFQVDYRLGFGTRANVPAGSVRALSIGDPQIPSSLQDSPLLTLVDAARNPLAVSNGVDPESATEIKQLTPEAYKAETFFAVRPEDYGAQAEKLDFVQRAQGRFRWTGSWLTAVTTVDPVDAFRLSDERRSAVETLLDCRRQAGRDVIVSDPKFANIDLEITICVARDAFPAHVRAGVLVALLGDGARRTRGFFHPENFTFGTPLRRSALEAAIQHVAGVDAVIGMRIGRHGVTDLADFAELAFEVADDEVIRLENSKRRPERGSLALFFEGGA